MTPLLSFALGAAMLSGYSGLQSAPATTNALDLTPTRTINERLMSREIQRAEEATRQCTFTFDMGMYTDVYPSMVQVFDQEGTLLTHLRFDMGDTLPLAPGTYDFIYSFGSQSNLMLGAVVVKEGVNVDSDREFAITFADEAKNHLKIENYDRDGYLMQPPIFTPDGTQVTQGNITGGRYDLFLSVGAEEPKVVFNTGLVYWNAMTSPEVYISDLSDRYTLSFNCFSLINGVEDGHEQVYYIDNYSATGGLSDSITFSNKDNTYRHASVKFSPSEDAGWICLDASATYDCNGQELFGVSSVRQDLANDATLELYLNCPYGDTPGVVYTHVGTSMSDTYRMQDGVLYIEQQTCGPGMKQTANGEIVATDEAFPLAMTDGKLEIARCPYLFTGLELCKDWIGVPMYLFSGRSGEYGYADFNYEFVKNGDTLQSGYGRGDMYVYFLYNFYPPFEAADYCLVVSQLNYGDEAADGNTYSAQAQIDFDLGADDPTPPDFKMVQLLSDGKATSSFTDEAPVSVRLRAGDWTLGIDYATYTPTRDYTGNPSVEVAVSPHGRDQWQDLTVTTLDEYFSAESGAIYETEAISGLAVGSYDLKVTASDAGGNTNTQILYKAFEINSSSAIGTVKADTTLRVTGDNISISGVEGEVLVSVYDMAGRLVATRTISAASSVVETDLGLTVPGFYLIKAETAGRTFTAKTVI